MNTKKSGGDYEKFKRSLKDVIDSFERAKEWADLSNCLQKVKKQFDQHPETEIPYKKDLAKRLAQCLNPDLSVIHQLTLEIYQTIFSRQIGLNSSPEWGAEFGLFLSGLFNFYQFAAFEVKTFFLESLVLDQILHFEKELLLSLPGFMICMLPALEDQDSSKNKAVEKILQRTEQIVGTSEFYGEIWKAMLRTPRTRISAIKYLDKKIPRDLEAAKQLLKIKDKEKGGIYPSRYRVKVMPVKAKDSAQIETKVVVEEISNHEDTIKKLEEKFTIEDYYSLYYPMKEKLCINSLLAGLAETSVYVNRGVLDFLINHAPITGAMNTELENVKLIEGALNALLKKDFASQKKFFTWVLGHLDDDDETVPSEDDPAIKTLVPALKCLLKKYLDKNEIQKQFLIKEKTLGGPHSNPILIIQQLLNGNLMISEPILLHISVDIIKYIKFYLYEKKNEKSKDRFYENCKNLFDMVPNQLRQVWTALGELLSREINENKVENTYQVQAIELIDFCLRELREFFDGKGESNLSEYLRPILSSLLSGVSKLSNNMKNLENVLPALDLIGNIIYILNIKQQKNGGEEDMVIDFQNSVQNFNTFYVELCDLMTKSLLAAPENLSTQLLMSDRIDPYQPQSSELLKLKLDTFNRASQILNQIQQYSNIQQLNSMPEWLATVIKCSKTPSAKIALVSTETFLKILGSNKEEERKGGARLNDPIKKLQSLIVNSSGEAASSMSRSSIYQTLQETRNSHCIDIIKTLWSLLDEQEDHAKIVVLLTKFDELLPALFSEVVIDDLKDKAHRETKERGIKKFSIFWNLTARRYPDYKPFKERDTTDRRYGALHNVLHFLEQNDPTLRLSCKSWLQESKRYYNRILDPLIEEFLQNSKVFVSFSKQIFFYDQYDTKIVSENFGKLRNIILNTQDEMIKYTIETPCSDYIQKDFIKIFEWMKPENGRSKYLEIIVYITLQFIMGQAVQSVDHSLYQESQTVNASACEFMELILKSLENHPETSNKIAHMIIEPILRTFSQVIDNQNNAMQVNLLNLLKVIFFQCNFQTPETKDKCDKVFKDPKLIDSIIKGMKNEVGFVRYHFIQFATTIMEAAKQLLKPSDFSLIITKMIHCFCQLLQCVDVSLLPTQTTAKVDEKGNPYSRGRTFVKQQNLTSKQTIGGLIINQESDIVYLITGFKNMMNDALGIKVKQESKVSQQFMLSNGMSDQTMLINEEYYQAEGTSIFGKLSKFLGGGSERPVLGNNEEQTMRETIYGEFKKIIVSFIHCWNDLPIFTVRDFNFSRSGIFPYSNEDDQIMNKIIDNSSSNWFSMSDLSQLRASNVTRETTSTMASQTKQQYLLIDYINQKTNNVQRYIIDFLKTLADTQPQNLVDGILSVWLDKKNLVSTSNMHNSLEKLMQISQSVLIPHYLLAECLNKHIEKNGLKTTPPKSKKKITLEIHDVQRETLLCQFLYTYLVQNVQQLFNKYQTTQDITQIQRLYHAVLKFIQFFKESRQPPTLCWLIEIINILSIKYQPIDAYKNDQKLKKEYYETVNELLESIAFIINDSYKVMYAKNYNFLIAFPPQVYELLKRFGPKFEEFESTSQKQGETKVKQQQALKKQMMQSQAQIPTTTSQPRKPGAGVMMQQTQPKLLQTASLMSPAEDVFDEEDFKFSGSPSQAKDIGISYNNGMKIGSSMNKTYKFPLEFDPDYANNDYFFEEGQSTSEFMKVMSTYINVPLQDCPDNLIMQYHRFFTIITLKGCLYKMIYSILGGTQNAFEKIQQSLKIIVDEVLKVLNINKKDDLKDQGRVFIREAVTDFFASLMDETQIYLVKRYKQEISDLFFHENFFLMSRRNLRKWCKIINHFIDDHKDAVFDDLVYKWNTQAGLLTTKDTEEKMKENALKRVSFLLFSGNVDQYDDKIDVLLKKMTEGLKATKKIPKLQTQLFLLTRVLLLRLQTNTLTDALRKLWPHLLSELETIFRSGQIQNNHRLVIEAIKVVDLMSALNMEDFQMNQWIFLVDSYGMTHEQQKNQMEKQAGKDDFNAVNIDRSDLNTGGIFQPFILRYMQNANCTFYKQQTEKQISVEDYVSSTDQVARQIELRKSSIQFDKQDYDEDHVLETFAIGLHLNLNEYNVVRTEINKENFEATIEKDFIDTEYSGAK